MKRWPNFVGVQLYDSDEDPTFDLTLNISVEGADTLGKLSLLLLSH